MTSSLKATGHAAVRVTPGAAISGASVWSLAELTPTGGDRTAAQAAAQSADERQQARREGYAAGLADGQKKGAEAANARVAQAMAMIDKLVEQINAAASLAPSLLEENITALAVIVARQIVAREVSVAPEIVADLVRHALTEFPIDQAVRIRVHPLDLSLLTLPTAPDAQPITGAREASWLADPRIARGGCLVEGRDRIIDGRIDAALERAYHKMAAIDAS